MMPKHGCRSRIALLLTIFMSVATSAVAQTVTLSIAVSPSGGGTVTVDPPNTVVSTSQSFAYDSGTAIALFATPNPGFIFGSWSGDIVASGPVTTLLMDINRNVVANFVPDACTTTVPNVVGQPQANAEAAIAAASLAVGAVTTANSDSVPAGSVISQNPPGETSADCDAPVDLVVSLGPEPCTTTVPDVEGLEQSAAQAAIESADLVVETVDGAFSDSVPAGNVILQDPPAGFNVECGLGVLLVVSLGPEACTTTVPDVEGFDLSAAVAAITLADLNVENVVEVFSDTVPAGQVVLQDPPAGFVVDCGLGVVLEVSVGSEPCTATVPDLTGLTQGEADAALTEAMLTLGDVTAEFSDTVPAGQAIAQDPAPGEEVDCDTPVDLVISLGPEPCTTFVPELGGLTEEEAEFRLTLEGLELGEVRFVIEQNVPAGTIIDQSPLSGEQVACGSVVDIVVARDVCIDFVPDLTGLSAQDAIDAALAADLDPVIVPVYEPEGAPGTVVDQSIEPGTIALCGTRIEIGILQEPPKDLCVEWLVDAGGMVLVTPPGDTQYVLVDDVLRDQSGQPQNMLVINPKQGTYFWIFEDGNSVTGRIKVTVSEKTVSFTATDDRGRVVLKGRIYLDTGNARADLLIPGVGFFRRIFDVNFRDSMLPPETPEPPIVPDPDPSPFERRDFAFEPDTYVSVVALANPGFEFEGWLEPENGNLPFFTMPVTDDHTATARFRPSNRRIVTLQTMAKPEGAGVVWVDPSGQLIVANDFGDCFRLSPTTGAFTLCLADTPTPGFTSAAPDPPQVVIETGFVEVERAGTVLYFDDIDGMGFSVSGAISIPDRAGFVNVFDPVSSTSMDFTDEDMTDSVCDCDDTGENEHAYMSGSRVGLNAFPIPGFVFGFWTGPVDDPFNASTTFNIGQNAMTFANFVPEDAIPCTTAVPNVSGLSKMDAQTVLAASKLNVGQVREARSDVVPAGQVISQGTAAGSVVLCGTKIAIVVSSGCQVTVPSLHRKSVFEASALLFAEQLEVGTVTEQVSRTVPEGTVISQSIKPGERVDCGTKIDIVVSAIVDKCAIPDVTGQTFDEAVATLEAASFVVTLVDGRFDDTAPNDTVLEQLPKIGTAVPCGSIVVLVVSLGPCIAPDLTELNPNTFEFSLTLFAANVTQGVTTLEFSDTVAKGLVIRQNPPAGQVVPCDSPIDIVVSKGPEGLRAPNLIGLSRAEAEQKIQDLGLRQSRSISKVIDNTVPEDTVVDQHPPPGSKISENTPIKLVVSTGG